MSDLCTAPSAPTVTTIMARRLGFRIGPYPAGEARVSIAESVFHEGVHVGDSDQNLTASPGRV